MDASGNTIHDILEACRRHDGPTLVARVTRLLGDVGAAEEIVQDCFVTALEQWPSRGLPDNPTAWLSTAASRRAIDTLRHRQMAAGKHIVLHHEWQEKEFNNTLPASWDACPIEDDMLRLIFAACHPVLPVEARVALTLRLLGGLTVNEISRALLSTEAAVGQRITRAKRLLGAADISFELPESPAALSERLAAVLQVVYLIFNEGYSATQGDDWLREDLCREAMRLSRQLCRLAPTEPEVFGLSALLSLQGSRLKARLDSHGHPVLLADQDRRDWDRTLIAHGLRHLEQLGSHSGGYILQARIAACHARADSFAATPWQEIATHYDALYQLKPGPIIQINRAVAHGMAYGAEAGLALLDSLRDDKRVSQYHLYFAVRGDLEEKSGETQRAAESYRQAASLTTNLREQALLQEKAARC